MVFLPILSAKRGQGWQQDPSSEPWECALDRQLPPPALPKPRLQKEGRPTLGIRIDLEDIGMGGDDWWCPQPAPEPGESCGPQASIPVSWRRRRQAGPFIQQIPGSASRGPAPNPQNSRAGLPGWKHSEHPVKTAEGKVLKFMDLTSRRLWEKGQEKG